MAEEAATHRVPRGTRHASGPCPVELRNSRPGKASRRRLAAAGTATVSTSALRGRHLRSPDLQLTLAPGDRVSLLTLAPSGSSAPDPAELDDIRPALTAVRSLDSPAVGLAESCVAGRTVRNGGGQNSL